MPILALRLLLGRGLSAIWAWLSHRSFWRLVSMALCALLLVQHFQLADARHDRDSYKSQRDYYKGEIDKADAAVRRAMTDFKKIAKELKDRTDEENRRIAGDAGSLRVSGPGKAVCRPAPAPPGGHVQGGSKPNAPGPSLPPDERAAVPWGWLTDRAQEHDQLRAEVQTWREWYDRLVKEWPKNSK